MTGNFWLCVCYALGVGRLVFIVGFGPVNVFYQKNTLPKSYFGFNSEEGVCSHIWWRSPETALIVCSGSE